MINERRVRILRFSAVVAIVALVMIIWSLVHPRPLPVIVAMSVGQGLGTLSFLAFLYVIVADIRTDLRERRRASLRPPPAPPPSAPNPDGRDA